MEPNKRTAGVRITTTTVGCTGPVLPQTVEFLSSQFFGTTLRVALTQYIATQRSAQPFRCKARQTAPSSKDKT